MNCRMIKRSKLVILFKYIMNIGKSKTGDCVLIAILHQNYINIGFLSSRGLPFLIKELLLMIHDIIRLFFLYEK